jgi:phosphoribosylglycinamide formyltransferase-1
LTGAPETARGSEKRIAVLLSGRGSNFRAIADAVEAGEIPRTRIAAVFSDQPEAAGLAEAKRRGIEAHAVPRVDGMSRREHEAAVREILDPLLPDLICLAGYMRVLSPEFVAGYRGRILNIHPSLLPKYPGLDVQRRALEAGERESGCTVHFVDEGVDSGPIVIQRRVAILPGDGEESLSARILEQEHLAYPEAIRRVLGL